MDLEVVDMLLWEVPDEDLPLQLSLLGVLEEYQNGAKVHTQKGQHRLALVYKSLHPALKVTTFLTPVLERVTYRGRESFVPCSAATVSVFRDAINRRLQET